MVSDRSRCSPGSSKRATDRFGAARFSSLCAGGFGGGGTCSQASGEVAGRQATRDAGMIELEIDGIAMRVAFAAVAEPDKRGAADDQRTGHRCKGWHGHAGRTAAPL